MVVLSVSDGLMILFRGLKSCRHRSLGDPTDALADVLCGLTYAVGRQTFRFRLPSGFIVNLTDGGLGSIEAMRCGGLGAALRRGAGDYRGSCDVRG